MMSAALGTIGGGRSFAPSMYNHSAGEMSSQYEAPKAAAPAAPATAATRAAGLIAAAGALAVPRTVPVI